MQSGGLQPFSQALGKGPWSCLFLGVPLWILGDWAAGSPPLCARSWLAPTARRQRQGLTAVVSHPQGGRRVLISLWSRPGCAEHNVYAGGRWHRAAGNCWALLRRREAACPGALCRGGMSSRLGPGERPGRRGSSAYTGLLARAGRRHSCRAAVLGRPLGRGQASTQSSGCWDASSPLVSGLKHPEPDRTAALCCQAPAGVRGLRLGGVAFRQACRPMPPTPLGWGRRGYFRARRVCGSGFQGPAPPSPW